MELRGMLRHGAAERGTNSPRAAIIQKHFFIERAGELCYSPLQLRAGYEHPSAVPSFLAKKCYTYANARASAEKSAVPRAASENVGSFSRNGRKLRRVQRKSYKRQRVIFFFCFLCLLFIGFFFFFPLERKRDGDAHSIAPSELRAADALISVERVQYQHVRNAA